MTEAAFTRKNYQRWQEFEQSLKYPEGRDPDRLKELFLQLTDDLAYAETYFPQGEITQYLHNLAAKVHQRIFQHKKEERSRFALFWLYEVPTVAYHYRRYLLYSFLLFLVSVGIGAISASNDDTFVRLILGDAYVNMTDANIEKGDPMAVYKQSGRTKMFLGIAINNIRVAFMCFAFGLFSAIGTGWIMFQNGVMLGAFQFYFYQKGLFWTSFLTIWIHGTLEISVIIVAGAAGMILGNAWVFPGTYPRLESFQKGARRALKLVIGLVPIFIVAAFLEGFVTRLTELSVFSKSLIILSSAGFIVYYFIIYPAQLNQNGKLLDRD